jgi:N-acylneuraminate cytidylyltransferase
MSRTQDLERTYHDAGQFYWGKKDSWLMGKRMHGDGLGMVIPAWRVVDIDTEQDWKMAELIFQTIKLGI